MTVSPIALAALVVIRGHRITHYDGGLDREDLWSCDGCPWKGFSLGEAELHVASEIGKAVEEAF